MATFGVFLVSAAIFSTIWYLVIRKITRKIAYYEYKHGEVRRRND